MSYLSLDSNLELQILLIIHHLSVEEYLYKKSIIHYLGTFMLDILHNSLHQNYFEKFLLDKAGILMHPHIFLDHK
jgi:ABC-type oligopeptide transport system ATPase subunit